jgi:hypothetical protein
MMVVVCTETLTRQISVCDRKSLWFLASVESRNLITIIIFFSCCIAFLPPGIIEELSGRQSLCKGDNQLEAVSRGENLSKAVMNCHATQDLGRRLSIFLITILNRRSLKEEVLY